MKRNIIKGTQPEMVEYLKQNLQTLADNICQDPKEIEQFTQLWNQDIKGFHNYSINNLILAYFQLPDFSLLGSFGAFKKVGRTVKKGEKAIRILAPNRYKIEDPETGEEKYILKGFRPAPVFDISQTEGEELNLGCSELIQGESAVTFETIEKVSPVPVEIKELGSSNGRTNGDWIQINPKENKTAMITTLIHEIAHIRLGHCKENNILAETEERSVKEIEAETVSFIVSTALGIDNQKSRLYIGNWGANKKELENRGKKLISVAEQILREIREAI
jgi:hypothetical protein